MALYPSSVQQGHNSVRIAKRREAMPRLGMPEILLLLVVVVLLFGVGRISKIAGELGSSIRDFRKRLREEDEEPESKEE